MLASSTLIPCRSDPAGCGLSSAYQALIIPVEVVFVAGVNVVSALRRQRELALKRGFLTLMLVPICLMVLGLASDLYGGRRTQSADVLELLQFALLFWTITLVQWLLFRNILAERGAVQDERA